MRSNRKKTGLVIFLTCFVVLIGVGSAFLMNIDLAADEFRQTIADNPVPLSGGDDVIFEPSFEPQPQTPAEQDDPGREERTPPSGSSNAGGENMQPGEEHNNEALTGRKKREDAADQIEFQRTGGSADPGNVSAPAELTDVTETEEEADREIEDELASNGIPKEGSVRVTVNPDGPVEVGQTVKLSAHVRGFEKGTYTLRWQVREQEDEWVDIQGANGKSLKLVINEDNITYLWRVVVELNEV